MSCLRKWSGIAQEQSIYRLRVIYAVTAAALVTILLTQVTSVLSDPDNWWHVRVGLDMLSNLAFPEEDTYSHTHAGKSWIAKEWLSQIILALAYSSSGWNGVELVAYGAIALTIFLVVWYITEYLKPTVAIGLCFFLALVLIPFFNARPFLFTFPIVVIWTAQLFRTAGNGRSSSFWSLWLLCLWANLHASFTLGFVIAFFAGVEFIDSAGFGKPRQLARWIAFGALCPFVTLLNPYGIKAILATFSVAHGNEAVQFITEWRPFNASANYIGEAVLLLCIFGVLVSNLRLSWPRSLFSIFILHLFFIHFRFSYLFYLLVPMVAAPEIASRYSALSVHSWIAERRDWLETFLMTRFHLVLLGMVFICIIAASASVHFSASAPAESTSARGALAFAAAENLEGNVYNSYDFGGTLIFHGIKTFIDGRTDQLFQDGFTTEYYRAGTSAGKPVLERQLDAYTVTWALLRPNDDRVPIFEQLERWERVYSDHYAVIYTRK